MKNKYTRKLRIVAAGEKFIVQRRVLLFWWICAIYGKSSPLYFDTVELAEKEAHRLYSKNVVKVL